MFDLQIGKQIQPVHHLFGRLIGLLNQLLQLIGRQVKTVVVVGVNQREFFSRFTVHWMFRQMSHIVAGLLCRVRFSGFQMALVFQQSKVFHPFGHGNAFSIVAGLLNLLVVIDAYDVAMGRK